MCLEWSADHYGVDWYTICNMRSGLLRRLYKIQATGDHDKRLRSTTKLLKYHYQVYGLQWFRILNLRTKFNNFINLPLNVEIDNLSILNKYISKMEKYKKKNQKFILIFVNFTWIWLGNSNWNSKLFNWYSKLFNWYFKLENFHSKFVISFKIQIKKSIWSPQISNRYSKMFNRYSKSFFWNRLCFISNPKTLNRNLISKIRFRVSNEH